ncbi:MAG: hypothetical protein RL732_347 [Bacteroidota bacterium]
MNKPSQYQTIAAKESALFTDKGSKFLAYTFPIETTADFKRHLDEIKKEHPKATHHCFAYRLGQNKDQFRANDDGEPSGTAGRPILGQIDSLGLTNVLIIVVRYFGGTLLGVPGLINAYKSAAAAVLERSAVLDKKITIGYRIECDYTSLNEVIHLLKQEKVNIIEKNIGLYCDMVALLPVERKEPLIKKLGELPRCTATEIKDQ